MRVRESVSLREKEKEINKMLLGGTNDYGSRITLNDMLQFYIKRKRHKGRPLTVSTVDNYIRMWNRNIRDTPLGNKKIDKTKKTDIVFVFSDMHESGLSYGTVEFFSKPLYSVFNIAIDDEIILKSCKTCYR